MKTYKILHDLLHNLESYEHQRLEISHSIEDFARWILQNNAKIVGNESLSGETIETHRVSQLVVYLQRYAKQYARKALEDTILSSEDEFVYLIILYQAGPMSKTALIHENRHEKPTGMDIIRRMIEAGFMGQSDNPDDGRSKLLHITPEGRELIERLNTRMDFVAELVTGNLKADELQTLIYLLEKLENYHQFIQAKTKGGDFADLIRAVKQDGGAQE